MKRIIFSLLILYSRLYSIINRTFIPLLPRASLFHPVSPARTRFSFRDPPLSLGLTSIFTSFQDPYFPVSRIESPGSPPHSPCVDRDRRAIQLSIFRVTTVLTDHVNDTLSSCIAGGPSASGIRSNLQPPVGRMARGISMSHGRSWIDRSIFRSTRSRDYRRVEFLKLVRRDKLTME